MTFLLNPDEIKVQVLSTSDPDIKKYKTDRIEPWSDSGNDVNPLIMAAHWLAIAREAESVRKVKVAKIANTLKSLAPNDLPYDDLLHIAEAIFASKYDLVDTSPEAQPKEPF